MYIYTNLATKRHTFIGVAVLVLLLATAGAFSTSAPMSSLAALVSSATARYGQLPLSFVPNAGQSDGAIEPVRSRDQPQPERRAGRFEELPDGDRQ